MPLSTTTPERLPDIEVLRRLAQSIAMLDAIIYPDWQYRFYSYNSKWAQGEEMASMRNGCGDDWFLLFGPHGAALKGFAHESPLAQEASFAASIQEAVPPVFSGFLKEPAFSMNRASFCVWRSLNDPAWNVVTPVGGSVSPDLDGSAELIGILDGNPETYRAWAEDYYEREIPLASVQAVYEHQALNERLVATLNPELSLSALAADEQEIGYPSEPIA